MSPDHMSTEESVVSGAVRCAEAASSAKEVGSVNCANETEANVSRSVSRRLRGRGFSVLGDSISTLMGWVPEGWRVHYEGEVHVDGVESPQDTWWGRVIDHFDGRLVANSSFSGSVVEGYGFPAGNSEKRITSLLGAQGECPDVVLVYMGVNDYGWGGGRNQVMGGSLSASARPEEWVPYGRVDRLPLDDSLSRTEGRTLANDHTRRPIVKIGAVRVFQALATGDACTMNKTFKRGTRYPQGKHSPIASGPRGMLVPCVNGRALFFDAAPRRRRRGKEGV